jgi:hypothetical protein
MKYAVKRASGGMIFIPSYRNISSCFQRLLRRRYRHKHTQQDNLIRLVSFSENEESMLKKKDDCVLFTLN